MNKKTPLQDRVLKVLAKKFVVDGVERVNPGELTEEMAHTNGPVYKALSRLTDRGILDVCPDKTLGASLRKIHYCPTEEGWKLLREIQRSA